MKGTIVLLAGNEAENYGRKIMYEAHKAGNVGFEMARLPQHVSLKQPFSIPSLEQFEEFFDTFARNVHPLKIQFEELNAFPSNILGGVPSGCMSISAKKSNELASLQKELFQKLDERFGPCPAEHDDDYIFHMTVAIGGADYSNYKKAHQDLCRIDFHRELIFDKLGLLYYDNDDILPGTYFCYKVAELY